MPPEPRELVTCPKCGYRRDPDAERCANCEARWVRARAYRPPVMTMPPLGCIALVVIVGACIATVVIRSYVIPLPAGGVADAGLAFAACSHAQDFVRDRLVSPSTAKFQINCFWDQGAAREASGDWSAIGTVDSQNSFGAMVRSTYVVELSNASGSWQLVGITMYP